MEALIHHFKLVTEGFRVPPRRGLRADREPARGAGLLRGRGRLGEAVPRAHARPVVREPAGAAGDGRRRLHRRHDHEPRDARPDPRGHRQDDASSTTCAAFPARATALPPRSGRARGSRPTRPRCRSPADVAVPEQLRATIEHHMALYPGPPLGGAARAARSAGASTAGSRREAMLQVAAVMQVTPGLPRVDRELLRHARARARRPPHDLRVHQHLRASCAAPRTCSTRSSEATGAPVGGSSPDGEFHLRSFECLGACDIAPMASIEGHYRGPADARGRARRSPSTCATGGPPRTCCRKSAVRRR